MCACTCVHVCLFVCMCVYMFERLSMYVYVHTYILTNAYAQTTGGKIIGARSSVSRNSRQQTLFAGFGVLRIVVCIDIQRQY